MKQRKRHSLLGWPRRRWSNLKYHLGIVWTATDDLIDMARLGISEPEYRVGDIGYGVRRDRTGEGIATKAAGLLLDLGFADLGCTGSSPIDR